MHIAIATVPPPQTPNHQTVGYGDITMPVMAAIGGMIIISGVLVKIAWQLSTEKGRIDNNEKAIAALQKEKENDNILRSQLREELKHSLKADITASATDICHSFELFAVEIRTSINSLRMEIDSVKTTFKEGLDARNQTVNRLYQQTGKNAQALLELEAKLNQYGIPFQHRYRGDDPPSNPANYS